MENEGILDIGNDVHLCALKYVFKARISRYILPFVAHFNFFTDQYQKFTPQAHKKEFGNVSKNPRWRPPSNFREGLRKSKMAFALQF